MLILFQVLQAPSIPSITVQKSSAYEQQRDSVSSFGSFGGEQADGQLDAEWNDSRSSASDTISHDDTFGTIPRTNTMSRSGTVRKSMNRYAFQN